MELLFAVLLILSVVGFVAGLSLLVGFGWALILFDLISQSSLSDYPNAQKSYGGAKNEGHKLLGLVLVMISVIIFVYVAKN